MSALLAAERRDEVLTILRTEGKVRAAELAARLDVSLDTVRRDLAELADAGLLRRVHGGALPLPPPGPAAFRERLGEDVAAKEAVAAAAVPFVRPGEVVAMGGGATLLELARLLPDHLDATVIATGPDVAVALADHRGLRVDLIGGCLHPEARTVTGPDAVDALRAVRPHACLVSACTVHPLAGLTMRNGDEACVTRQMIGSSERVVVLATSAKLGTTGPYPVAELDAVDTLVTDAPESELGAYRGAGLEVVRA